MWTWRKGKRTPEQMHDPRCGFGPVKNHYYIGKDGNRDFAVLVTADKEFAKRIRKLLEIDNHEEASQKGADHAE